MGGRHDQATLADLISHLAEDLEAVGWIVGYSAVVLLVLGIAEEYDALDLLADSCAAVADGSGGEGSTLAVVGTVLSVILRNWRLTVGGYRKCLPVTSRHDLCTGALGVGQDKEVLHLSDCLCRCAVWQEVVKQTRRVGTTYSLDPDVRPAIFGLEDIGDIWPQ